jgi:LPPG:FO 2-phospho-L-lactate transferase
MIVALAGGVGGAKLAHGLALSLPPEELAVVVNTADDFELFGLHISPDLDTVLYTLAGLANPATGWGIAGDTRHTLDAIGRYGRDLWFQLGDQDFATHILRSERLRQGIGLGEVTAELASALGVQCALLPMTNDPVATKIRTADGDLLDFQDYFVARRQEDDVYDVVFEGADDAWPLEAALNAIAAAELIVLCPSNPIVSIGPIFAVSGYLDAVKASPAPVVAVSPIVGGKALKGPADKMLATLGHEVSAAGVAAIYQGFIDGLVIDEVDVDLAARIETMGIRTLVAPSIMRDEADRKRLAEATVAFGRSLRSARANA